MLARDEVLLDLHLLEEFGAELQLHGVAELRQVAAEDQEVGGGFIAWTSLTARTALSTKRVLSDFG